MIENLWENVELSKSKGPTDLDFSCGQFQVRVQDDGVPRLSDTTSVTFTIQTTRPLFFNPERYEVDRPENDSLNTVMATVTATDPLNVGAFFTSFYSASFAQGVVRSTFVGS